MLGFNKYMQPKEKYVLLKVRIFAGILRKQDFTENNFTFSCSFAKVNFFEKKFLQSSTTQKVTTWSIFLDYCHKSI